MDRRLPRRSHGSSFTSRPELEASCRHRRTPFLDTPTWTPRGKCFGRARGRIVGRNKQAPGSTLSAEAELIHLFMSAKKKSEERVYKVFARGRRGKLEAGKVRTALQPSGSFPSCRAYQAEQVCIFGAVSPLTLSPADVNGTLIAVALFFPSAGFGFFFVLFGVFFFGLPFWSLESFTNPR